eukprot:Nk52_evm1s2287 gene=Nk52_evmTU1s2287
MGTHRIREGRLSDAEGISSMILSVNDKYIYPYLSQEAVNFLRASSSPEAIGETMRADADAGGSSALFLVAVRSKKEREGDCDTGSNAGGEDQEVIEGVIRYKPSRNHLSWFFVSSPGKGMGRLMFEHLVKELTMKSSNGFKMTVNSSPFAVGFYQRMGFVVTGAEYRNEHDVRFTPMIFDN